MFIRLSRFGVLVFIIIAFALSSHSEALTLQLDDELSGDSIKKTLPKAEMLEREYLEAQYAFTLGFFSEARTSIDRIKFLARIHRLETPSGLSQFQKNCAVGRMNQLEQKIIDAYHDYDIQKINMFTQEAIMLSTQENIVLSSEIIRVTRKVNDGFLELPYRSEEIIKPFFNI